MDKDYVKTQAIVLERIVYGENSIILNVFSKEEDIIGIFINNISPVKSIIEFNVLSVNDFTLKKGSQFYYLVDCNLISSNFNIRTNYRSELFSLVIVDLTKSAFCNEVCNRKIYALILKTVVFLSKYSEDRYALIDALALRLVSCLGYQPSTFYQNSRSRFYLDGGFVNSDGEYYQVDNLHTKYMIYLMKNRCDNIINKRYKSINENKVLKILLKYTMNNFGIKYLGSLDYLEYL